MPAVNDAVLSNFNPLDQKVMMGLVGSWLGYNEVQHVMQSSTNQIAPVIIPGILTEKDFIETALSYLPSEEERRDYLAKHLVEVVTTQQLPHWLTNDPLITSRFKNVFCLNKTQLFLTAAFQGHHEIVRELLSIKGLIPDYLRKKALKETVEYGHLAVVQELLKNNNSHYRDAVRITAEYGQLAVIQGLLSNNVVIFESDRGQAVIAAAKKGHHLVVRELLSTNAVISDNDRSKAIAAAAKNGHHLVVQELR